ETNVEKIQSMLEAHQVQLLKDIAMLDKMYELNMAYFKELSMYSPGGTGEPEPRGTGHGGSVCPED
ncbi:toxic anion resistance protein, partial [Faecalibacterium prausnitzii]|uniref:toxic anion resistance protein n=1 Tax=Faecalibacterium prausnitzii TaxID=853 RepID=UPI00290DEC01